MINYYLLTKPGIILGNLFTFAAGFLLASNQGVNLLLFFETLFGLALIIASACVFNNYIDRPLDRKMERTKERALARGAISASKALLFAAFLGVAGAGLLALCSSLLTVCVALSGFFIYVVLYSFWKGHTVYATAIGSIAGAIPPVVGYCAAGNRLDAGAFILLAMLILWQMPHFFAIAMAHLKDYAAAGLPVLPVVKGVRRTKIHMALYIVAFIASALLLTLFDYTGTLYLKMIAAFGCAWLCLCLRGFAASDDQLWGRRMFQLSLLVIMTVCLLIPFDKVSPAL
jgi:protoheme IX farnesyltransferase